MKEKKYYVIETEYVGANCHNLATDYANIVRGHYYDVWGEPGHSNMGREKQTEGWLGTTNDWAQYAHGEHDSEDTARDWIERHLSEGYRVDATEPEGDGIDGPIVRYYVGNEKSGHLLDPGDWLEDVVGDYDDGAQVDIADIGVIRADTTDDDLARLCAEIEAIADSEGVTLWHTIDYLRGLRNDCKGRVG